MQGDTNLDRPKCPSSISTEPTMILTHKVLQFSSVDDTNPYTYGLYDNQEVAQSVADDWNVIYQNGQNGWFAKVELL